jgi:long-chain acyl-CoA synthetase
MLYDLICNLYKKTPKTTLATFVSGDDSESYCFSEIDYRVSLFEKSLNQSNRQGDLLLTNLTNQIDLLIVYLACAKLKLTIMPIPRNTQRDSFISLVSEYRPKYLLLESAEPDEWTPNYGPAFCDDYRIISCSGLSNNLFYNYNQFDFSRWYKSLNKLTGSYELKKTERLFTQFITTPSATEKYVGKLTKKKWQSELSEREIPYIVTTTSGSTSKPKPILLGQQTKLIRAQSILETYELNDNDCMVISTPLYHSLAMRIMITGLLLGSRLVILKHYSPEIWLRAVKQYQVNFALLVSTQIKNIIASEHFDSDQLRSLTCLVSSSAKLDEVTKNTFLAQQQFRFFECYGTSEVAVASSIEFDQNEANNFSVGKAVRGVGIEIDTSQSESYKNNALGEIKIHSPMQFMGYLNTSDNLDDAEFSTGDLGYVDANGDLYYMGRLKETINVGGVTIYPEDIESKVKEFLLSTNIDCAAVGVPDEALGEVVALAVSPAMDIDFNELYLFLLRHLRDEQMPKHYFNVDALAKTALGKLQRTQIKRQVQQLIANNVHAQTESYYCGTYS